MPGPFIRYKDGYKYQLFEDYEVTVQIVPDSDIRSAFIDLDRGGRLVIKKGYAWDGPSGPTIDTLNFMRGSLVHDALYQLMREGGLDADRTRALADDELVRICREDGMWSIRAWWVHTGVRLGGGAAARKPREVLQAPRPEKSAVSPGAAGGPDR